MRKTLSLIMLLALISLAGCASSPSTPAAEEEESPVIALIRKLLPESPQVKRQKFMERLSSPDVSLDQRVVPLYRVKDCQRCCYWYEVLEVFDSALRA